MTFWETFRKNVARIECAAHQKILCNACILLKKIQLAKNFPKLPKIFLGHFQKQLCRGFLSKICSWGFRKIQRKSRVMESPLNKVAVFQQATLFKNETPAKALSYEFSGFSKTPPWGCLVFHYFMKGFSLWISFCRIL